MPHRSIQEHYCGQAENRDIHRVLLPTAQNNAARANILAAESKYRALLDDFNCPMIVAVVAVRKVEMSINEIIGVIAMRYSFMTTVCTVRVVRIVAVADVAVGADVKVGLANGDDMLINVSLMKAVQMTVVQVIDMALMLNGGVTAVGAMLVGVILVNYMIDCHDECPF